MKQWVQLELGRGVRLTFLCSLPTPTSTWLDSAWGSLCRLPISKISFSQCWEKSQRLLTTQSASVKIPLPLYSKKDKLKHMKRSHYFPLATGKLEAKTVVSAKCWRYILMNPPRCTPCLACNKWLRNVCIMESEIKQKYSIKCLHWTCLSIQPHFLLSPLEPFARYNELHAVPYSPHAVSCLCVLHGLEQPGHPDLSF